MAGYGVCARLSWRRRTLFAVRSLPASRLGTASPSGLSQACALQTVPSRNLAHRCLHVIDSARRSAGCGQGAPGAVMDQTHGGAGLVMMVCHNASSAMLFDVARGRHTEVTAMFEIDMNLREFRTQAKSLHFWSH